MDNSEFETRVFANPDDRDQDFLDALQDDPRREQLLSEVQTFNESLTRIATDVSVPPDLAARLKSVTASDQAAIPAAGDKVVKLAEHRRQPMRMLATAAVLVLAVGVTYSSLFGSNQPSAQELEFGHLVVDHVYHELDEIYSRPGASFQQANQVFGAVGGSISSPQAMDNLGISLAKPCIVIPQSASAHLVMDGSMGVVNIIVINNSPVRRQFNLTDGRFDAVVIPLENGNLILIGEKNETFSEVQQEIDDNVTWVI